MLLCCYVVMLLCCYVVMLLCCYVVLINVFYLNRKGLSINFDSPFHVTTINLHLYLFNLIIKNALRCMNLDAFIFSL